VKKLIPAVLIAAAAIAVSSGTASAVPVHVPQCPGQYLWLNPLLHKPHPLCLANLH
jgi:hypothetical protein